jgi:hypothetical protein
MSMPKKEEKLKLDNDVVKPKKKGCCKWRNVFFKINIKANWKIENI